MRDDLSALAAASRQQINKQQHRNNYVPKFFSLLSLFLLVLFKPYIMRFSLPLFLLHFYFYIYIRYDLYDDILIALLLVYIYKISFIYYYYDYDYYKVNL